MFIKDMLMEELQNSIQIRKDFERALNDLPKGSLVRKVIGGHEYFYLALRDGGKVRFNYLGKLSNDEVSKHAEAKKYRARYRKQISEVDLQIKFIQKALRGKGSV
jgi:hypothetical protein